MFYDVLRLSSLCLALDVFFCYAVASLLVPYLYTNKVAALYFRPPQVSSGPLSHAHSGAGRESLVASTTTKWKKGTARKPTRCGYISRNATLAAWRSGSEEDGLLEAETTKRTAKKMERKIQRKYKEKRKQI